jgi:hypothetical protein
VWSFSEASSAFEASSVASLIRERLCLHPLQKQQHETWMILELSFSKVIDLSALQGGILIS